MFVKSLLPLAAFLAFAVRPAFSQSASPDALDHAIAPDSVDYALWVHEAFAHGLHGFSVRTVDINVGGSHPDTLSEHFSEFSLRKVAGEVVFSGDHPISDPGDSIEIEFDSVGRPLSETSFEHNNLSSTERWKYDDRGRLVREWYDYALDGWHAPEEFFYNADGALERVEIRNSDGSLQGNHIFHLRTDPANTSARQIVEYDTSYINGRGLLTAIQFTAFDSAGRVERYQYHSVGFDKGIRSPFGFLNVYHDSAHGYSMEQYALAERFHHEPQTLYAKEPSRWIVYDSSDRSEQQTLLDSTGMKLMEQSHYLPDERYVSSYLATIQKPIQSIACTYTDRGLIESIATRNLRTGWDRVMLFTYSYSATGP